ncbi:MAG: VCBS repeat-containing protein, partial [Rubrobacter sp.]|nr:VCBS repeat-containing protein [Rubrobacter sp.]
MDNDGQHEVVCSTVWGAYNSALLFYKHRDGRYQILRKDPQNIGEEYNQGDTWFVSAHVADINDDGQVEVVSEPKPLGRI